MNIPECYNAKAHACARSDTYVLAEREIDGKVYFVIKCRTCSGINVWPSESADGKGRYDAFLRKQAELAERERERENRKIYSF